MVYPERRFIMKNNPNFLPDKTPMFVDCKQVGRSKFYKDSPVKKTPTFSKQWSVKSKGTC